MKLAVLFAALFIVWVLVADLLYRATLANMATNSFGEFLHAVFTTGPGWALLIRRQWPRVLVCPDSTCARPGVLPGRDRPSRARRNSAIRTSIAAARSNPGTVAIWGLTVAAILLVGSIPLLLGLAVALPVLSHASWHLYRGGW